MVYLILIILFTAHIVEDRRMRNPLNNSSPISTQCYARVFISVKGDQRSRFSRSSNNIVTGSGGSVGSADGVGFADNEGTSILLLLAFCIRVSMHVLNYAAVVFCLGTLLSPSFKPFFPHFQLFCFHHLKFSISFHSIYLCCFR